MQAALKKALEAELASVAAKNSLTELVAFEKAQKHPELIRQPGSPEDESTVDDPIATPDEGEGEE